MNLSELRAVVNETEKGKSCEEGVALPPPLPY